MTGTTDAAAVCTICVRSLKQNKTKSGKPYYSGDASLEGGAMVEYRVWATKGLEWLPGTVKAHGYAVVLVTELEWETWNDSRQLKIIKAKLEPDQGQLDRFAPPPMGGKKELAELIGLVEMYVPDAKLKAMLLGILEMDTRWLTHPAARSVHHAGPGGLIYHTTCLARLAVLVGGYYQSIGVRVDVGLLVAGAILHDVGKLSEITGGAGNYHQSSVGVLVGHVGIGLGVIWREAIAYGLDQDTMLHLMHIIASHHGELEHGALVKPKTLEAVVFHQLDMLDSRVGIVERFRQEHKQQQGEGASQPVTLGQGEDAFVFEKYLGGMFFKG